MRVVVVDDTRLFRDGIVNLLKAQGHEIVGEAANGQEAIDTAELKQPDLILMDLRMPVINGLDATRIIKTRRPDLKVVILTVSDDEEDLVEAIKSGADGYLLKDITAQGLLEELETISKGGAVITKSLAGKLLQELRGEKRSSGQRQDQTVLSPRELEVLELVATGSSNKETAGKLFITENTVKYHMKRILEKLQLENRAQVIAWAARHMPPRRL